MAVLSFTDRGIYCPAGDFYIDPARPVPRALLTHGHSDHARRGHAAYLATEAAAPVLRLRLGRIALETIPYGETRQIGAARVSFHPAGHVPGSAQIRVEVAGEVWVVSGDYKPEPDGVCEPFAPLRCHTFISECTFGLPVFRWAPQAQVMAAINRWWAQNRDADKQSVIGVYALGKAQRILAHLEPGTGPILLQGAVAATTQVLRTQGLRFPATTDLPATPIETLPPGALLLTSSASPFAPGLAHPDRIATAQASGWMALRTLRRSRGTGQGFVLSDHADWPGLNQSIAATGAEKIYVTHGYTEVFCRWLRDQGHDADVLAPPAPRQTPA